LKIIILYIVIAIFTSCSSNNEEIDKGKLIAQAGNSFLYESQLIDEMPTGLEQEDSLDFLSSYINLWIRNKLVLEKAEEILPSQSKDIKLRLEKYKEDLLSFEFEQMYIRGKLDTVIDSTEISKYYNSNKDKFILKDYIVKCMFLKINKATPDIKDINKAYLLRTDDDDVFVRTYAQKYALKFHHNPNHWIYFNEISSKIPLENYNKLKIIKSKKKFTFEKNDAIYFVNIYDYKIKDDYSPLSFETNKIKNIILNARTNEIRKELRDELYKDAQELNTVKNYIND
jgi:hypothetical protein